ncbi:hypothetical protein PV08_06470 [Exophiala spinifera]|uniref:Glutathione S-transferase n=1 Tax=Exophiala spinifera TaxID=91928 RepID=A0A0D2BBN0_9EURO|nr:uncharacterized protein PV08_06470 [Exophiala spinifera]KIW16418.1 hypothetical protein PV08_06470 [Exophiala spinifera]
MAYTLTVPDKYGYVVLVALGLAPVLAFSQGILVGLYRKPARVPYPNPYATAQEAKENPAAYKFNCAQRAHGNLLENMPQAIASMLFAGLGYPVATAALGAGWIFFRIVYAYGYIEGSKAGGRSRLNGSGFWVMQALIWGLCVSMGLKML